jgi:hypothetical protein
MMASSGPYGTIGVDHSPMFAMCGGDSMVLRNLHTFVCSSNAMCEAADVRVWKFDIWGRIEFSLFRNKERNMRRG